MTEYVRQELKKAEGKAQAICLLELMFNDYPDDPEMQHKIRRALDYVRNSVKENHMTEGCKSE